MRENDVRAIVEILYEIKNNEILTRGFEELLLTHNYPDLDLLAENFQKICDIMDEWKSPVCHIALMQEMQCCMLDVEKDELEIRLAVAGSYYEFMTYCRDKRICPSTIQYVSDLDHIRGYRDCKMLLLDGFTNQKDYFEIKTYCDTRNIERIVV